MTKIPPDLLAALQSAGLADFFADCTGPHQNEYLKWIGEAKRPDTRKTRITKAVTMIAAKRDEAAAKLAQRAKRKA